MIICSRCNAQNSDDSLFCFNCGSKIEVPETQQCLACGNIYKASSKFCNKCGTPSGSNPNAVVNSEPEPQAVFVPIAQPVEEPVVEAPSGLEDPFAAFRGTSANPPVEATELITDSAPEVVPSAPVEKTSNSKASPFDAFRSANQPVETPEPIVEPEPIAMPDYSQPQVDDVTELITDSEPDPVVYDNQVTEILEEVETVPAVAAIPDEPAMPVEPEMPAVPAMPVEPEIPDVDPLSNYDIVQPEDPFASLNSNAAMPGQATELLTDDIPAYNPPVAFQDNGEDYSYAQPANYQPDMSVPEVQDVPKKKKKKKSHVGLIIFLVILALLIGGGIFAYTQGWLDTPIEKVKGILGIGDEETAAEDEDEEEKLSLNDIELPDIPDQHYTGEGVIPSFTIAIGDKKLKEGEDYTIECTNNITIGTATITITGIGDITGSATGTFKIIYGDPLVDDPNNEPMVNYVIGLYTNILGRVPTGEELLADCKAIRSAGFNLEYYVVNFFNKPEYQQMVDSVVVPEEYSSLTEYLVAHCIYLGVMGRSADPDGLKGWTEVANGSSIPAVAETLVTDPGVSAQIRQILGIQ